MNAVHAAYPLVLAALAILACAPPEKGPAVQRARGNEPFWAVTFEGEGATFRTPELPDGINYREGRWKRQGTRERNGFTRRVASAPRDSGFPSRSPRCRAPIPCPANPSPTRRS